MEWLVREADKRGMVVMIGVIAPRKDQEFYADEDIRHAIEETARFLKEKKLHNIFVNDLCDEFNHPLAADKLLVSGTRRSEEKGHDHRLVQGGDRTGASLWALVHTGSPARRIPTPPWMYASFRRGCQSLRKALS